jgi:hypothetical protein
MLVCWTRFAARNSHQNTLLSNCPELREFLDLGKIEKLRLYLRLDVNI